VMLPSISRFHSAVFVACVRLICRLSIFCVYMLLNR